jgi:ribosome-binding factor A
MNIRKERLADLIQRYASESVLAYEQAHDHDFGIISVLSVDVSTDYSYADISVMSQKNEVSLPKFLSPTEGIIRKYVSRNHTLWKIPRIRFRINKKDKNTNDILTLIHSLDTQYGLSQEHHPVDQKEKK